MTPADPALRSLAVAALLSVCALGTSHAASLDHSHAAWTKILSTHVKNGSVAYSRLKRNRALLDTYLQILASVSKADRDRWSAKQRLAYWINVYNACTVHLILENHPLESIRDIGLLPGAAWRQTFIPIATSSGAKTISLNDVEHEIIRKRFDEPRIHFALVCAAKSCPKLRSEAYRASILETQLDEQARTFLGDPASNRFDKKTRTLHLSSIFKWYRGDFEKRGSLEAYVRRYLDLGSGRVQIEFLDYDWSLNDD